MRRAGSDASSSRSPSACRLATILIPLFLFAALDRTIINLFIPMIERDLALSDSALALLSGASLGLGIAVAIIPAGYLADHLDRRLLLAGGVALWSVMTATAGMAHNFTEMFISRMGVGIGEAALTPAAYAIISGAVAPARRSRMASYVVFGTITGGGLSLIIGGFFAGPTVQAIAGPTVAGWRIGFAAVGMLGLLLSPLPYFLPASYRHREESILQHQPSLREFILGNAGFAFPYLVALLLSNMFGYGIITWQPIYFIRSYGLVPQSVGLVLGVISIGFGLVGTLLTGWLATALNLKVGRDMTVVLLTGCFATALPLVVATFFPVSVALNLVGAAALQMVCSAIGVLAPVGVMAVVPASLRGRVLGAYAFLLTIGGMALGAYGYARVAEFFGLGSSGFWKTLMGISLLLLTMSLVAMWIAQRGYRRALASILRWNGESSDASSEPRAVGPVAVKHASDVDAQAR